MAIDLALAGVGENDEFVAEIAADRAGLGHHRHRFQSHAGEGAQIGHEHLVVGFARVVEGEVEGIGILHQELAAPHHAESWPDLIAELPLDVIEDARQVLVGLHAVAEDRGDQLLVGGPVQHLALVAVGDAQHLLAVDLVTAALLPDLGGLDGGHQQFERAGAVLLLAHDLLDVAQYPKSKRQPGIDAGARLADQAGPEHQPMRDDLRFLGVVAQQRQEIAAEAHGHRFGRWGGCGGAPPVGMSHAAGEALASPPAPWRLIAYFRKAKQCREIRRPTKDNRQRTTLRGRRIAIDLPISMAKVGCRCWRTTCKIRQHYGIAMAARLCQAQIRGARPQSW